MGIWGKRVGARRGEVVNGAERRGFFNFASFEFQKKRKKIKKICYSKYIFYNWYSTILINNTTPDQSAEVL